MVVLTRIDLLKDNGESEICIFTMNQNKLKETRNGFKLGIFAGYRGTN